MQHLIVVGIMRLIGLTVRRSADVTPRGIQARMGWLLVLLPISVVPLFIAFGFYALQDPDPGDRACSILGFGLAAVFVLASAYFLTFRLVLEGNYLRTSSLVTADKTIDLQEHFAAEFDHQNQTLQIRQGRTKIMINWMMSGHEQFIKSVMAFDENSRDESAPGD